MTEKEWDECPTPHRLVEQLFGKEGLGRKRRLLLCACTRLMFPANAGEVIDSLAIAESYADGLATADQRREVNQFARSRASQHVNVLGYSLLNRASLQDASHANVTGAVHLLYRLSALLTSQIADAIRDIFGNPFRPVAFSPAWRTDTALTLARQMYESRDFGAMPILADALQDAGCEQEDILGHCRDVNLLSVEPLTGSPVTPSCLHVRGCWVVDLVLGKA